VVLLRTSAQRRLGIFFLAGLFSGVMLAKEGRYFTGQYDTVDAVDTGEEIVVTFVARIQNYSDQRIVGATVILTSGVPRNREYAHFSNLEVGDRKKIVVKTLIAVPKREFEAWQKGLRPQLEIHYHDSEGRSLSRLVDLIHRRVQTE
jgi:hypothetical protein